MSNFGDNEKKHAPVVVASAVETFVKSGYEEDRRWNHDSIYRRLTECVNRLREGKEVYDSQINEPLKDLHERLFGARLLQASRHLSVGEIDLAQVRLDDARKLVDSGEVRSNTSSIEAMMVLELQINKARGADVLPRTA